MSGGEVRRALEAGVDFVLIGRGAMLHHVYVSQVAADLEFEPIARPVAPGHREAEGFSDCFIGYIKLESACVRVTRSRRLLSG